MFLEHVSLKNLWSCLMHDDCTETHLDLHHLVAINLDLRPLLYVCFDRSIIAILSFPQCHSFYINTNIECL